MDNHLVIARRMLDDNHPASGTLELQLKGATERLYGVVRQLLEHLEEQERKRNEEPRL
jgi:hypothetical protein